jgi:hypothetical protein
VEWTYYLKEGKIGEKPIEPSAPALRISKRHFGEDIAFVQISLFALRIKQVEALL